MNFDLLDEQQMLRDSVARFVREAYAPENRRALGDGPEGFSRQHWKQFADLGWLGLSLPEDVGGLACEFVDTAILMEEFGRGLVLEPYMTSAVLCARILDRSASTAHRVPLLSKIISGELLVALAHFEDGGRHEPGRVAARAIAEPDGSFRLDGRKALVLDGPSADLFIVSAWLQQHLTLFVIERGTPGISERSYRLIDDSRASDLELLDVRAPATALLTNADVAELLGDAADRATLACVAQAVGAMEGAMEITADYIKARVQFGQPIGKFQALQHRMAEMFVEAQESRSILCRGLAHLDAEPTVRRKAVSAAKAVIGNSGRFVGGNAIQLHGGNGMTEEYAIGRYFKKLVTIEKLFGDTDFHLARLAAV